MLQDLLLTYDPVGNVVHVHDDGISPSFFDNQQQQPDWDHTYDPLYRLVAATRVVPTGAHAHAGKIHFGVVKSALQLGAPPPVGQQQVDHHDCGRCEQQRRQIAGETAVQQAHPHHPNWSRPALGRGAKV